MTTTRPSPEVPVAGGPGAVRLRSRCPTVPGWPPRPGSGPPATGPGRVRSASLGPGSTSARGIQAAATSSSSAQVPTAIPARNAAPRVVASRTGATSTGPPQASARAWVKTWLAVMPPSTRRAPDGQTRVGLGRLQQVGAPVGHALQDGTDQLRSSAAAGQSGERAPGAEVPHRRPEPEQGGYEPHVSGVVAGGGHGGRVGGIVDDPEVVSQPLHAGAGRQHDGLDAPGDPTRSDARR